METEPGKLFIGGISWDTNEGRLREYFQTFGEVMEAVIMKDRNTGRARGFGFVIFADPAIAERVVREKHMIDGRTVEAKKAVPREDQHVLNKNNGSLQGSPVPARTKKIFVGGLASTVTESDFKNYFDQFGNITDVVVMYDHNTQRPRGFGFITFDSEEAVDKVLLKTFHELNGKMVEVKRAVPKELSPGPSRNLLGGYNYGLSRVSSFLNAYTPGFNPSSVGGYGARMDGRFSPVPVGRSGYPQFSPSGYGMGLSFEPGSNPSYGGNGNFSSNIGYGRAPNPFYSGSQNRYNSPIGYVGGSGGTSSVLTLINQNKGANESLSYNANSANSNDFMRSERSSAGLGGDFASIRAIWGPSNISGEGGGRDSTPSSGNISYAHADSAFRSGVGGYGRNSGSNAAPSSFAASSDDHGPMGNLYGSGSFYGDTTWQSSSPDLEGSGSFAFGLGKVASDVTTKNSARYVGGYTVANAANRGIAA
ncbi:heterogeneous nuclear ribonucleoprotein 1-like [Diospyros lotus]|uniref:heterogeneous nuclear ribonucleoprotein 1-like n=1 Tax=Diospyros lotus TaxID=55363 RepID=UPI002254771E|nr:heterogeneous nuclear ribonucleoprotein 1-like [Diospyros lotus]